MHNFYTLTVFFLSIGSAVVGHVAAVSYTHLDVYKRQTLGTRSSEHPQQDQSRTLRLTSSACPLQGRRDDKDFRNSDQEPLSVLEPLALRCV